MSTADLDPWWKELWNGDILLIQCNRHMEGQGSESGVVLE